MKVYFILAIFGAYFLEASSSQLPNFTNPVYVSQTLYDSTIQRVGSHYFMCITYDKSIDILKSEFFTSFRYAESQTIYNLPTGYDRALRCHMMEFDGQQFLYFSMRNSFSPATMYVMQLLDPENPLGLWSAPTPILENLWNTEAIHGNVLKHNNNLYFLWADTHNATEGSIYIAPMENPTKVVQPFVVLTTATETWECAGYCTNEAPAFIHNRGTTYMVLTAGNPLNPDSCLTYMSIGLNQDPLNVSSWTSASGCVFGRNDNENVYAPTHATFTTSPDGTETFMMYHAHDTTTDIESRQARIDKVDWDTRNGMPIFPQPHGFNHPQIRPSGEPEMFTNPIQEEPRRQYEIFRMDNTYYLISLDNSTAIVVYESENPHDFQAAEAIPIYSELFFPMNTHIYEMDGELHMYFSWSADYLHTLKQYHVKAENSSNPTGLWTNTTQVTMPTDVWDHEAEYSAIMEHNNNRYFVWSGRPDSRSAYKTYIARMTSPTVVVPPVVLLREPILPWECNGRCSNIVSSFLYKNNVTYMVFGASSNGHCTLSYMSIASGKDPLITSNWVIARGPVFTGSVEEDVYDTCHARFTTSPDGTETWMLYRAMDSAQFHKPRLEKISWDETGSPIFSKAHGYDHPQPVPSSSEFFRNPIFDENSATISDSSVFKLGAFYYMTLSEHDSSEITVLKSGKLTDFNRAERITAYSAPQGYTDIRGSEMHEIGGQLYIYFTMQNEAHQHQIYVIQAISPDDPMADWSPETRLTKDGQDSSFFPSKLKHNDKQFIAWSSFHPNTSHSGIYLAEMENPVSVSERVLLLAEPVEDWECAGGCASEAPSFVYENGIAYMVYNVGTACNSGYGLTYMSIQSGKDPMTLANWFKDSGLVFGSNREENVYCTGHASFTKSPDNKETWMLYHASDTNNSTNDVKNVRIEKISWSEEGTPRFPMANGYETPQVIPARQKFH